jgi:DNA modification methylase
MGVNTLFDHDRYAETPIFASAFDNHFREYQQKATSQPVFFCGDAVDVLSQLPSSSFDCVMTSPPYYRKREYASGGIGMEKSWQEFVDAMLKVTSEIHRVLKPTGSFWLNIGDSHRDKRQLAIPWRLAIRMCDEQSWILRESIVWHKVKGGPDQSADRLRNVHEPVFHFVKTPKYYFDVAAVRNDPKKTKVVNGSIVSATGVSGVRYRRQIELSTALSEKEKAEAMSALDEMLNELRMGKAADFRMIIRQQQRTTHSDSELLSGRAKELRDRGYYFLRYHPDGSKPSDVWEILPEDTQRDDEHFAPYPRDLCKIPILSTCPSGGLVLDPFCGTGTTNIVASSFGRKSVGIDLSLDYLKHAHYRSETDE